VHSIECDQLGYAVIALGGGRRLASDSIDYAVGFINPKKIGDKIKKGEALIMMHYNDSGRAEEAEKIVNAAYNIQEKPVTTKFHLICERIV
jgi:thymidine phosphorylase